MRLPSYLPSYFVLNHVKPSQTSSFVDFPSSVDPSHVSRLVPAGLWVSPTRKNGDWKPSLAPWDAWKISLYSWWERQGICRIPGKKWRLENLFTSLWQLNYGKIQENHSTQWRCLWFYRLRSWWQLNMPISGRNEWFLSAARNIPMWMAKDSVAIQWCKFY